MRGKMPKARLGRISMASKGQVSVEYLFTTGIALGILVLIVTITLNIGNDSIRVAQAKDSVDTLAKAADYVHSLGPGSKDTVRIYLPSAIQFINVSQDRLAMRTSLSSGNSDVFAKTKAELIGAIVAKPGMQDVLITSLPDGRVLFGASGISCSPSAITLSVNQSGSVAASVNVENIAGYQITGLSANVTGSVLPMAGWSGPAGTIAAGASSAVSLSFAPNNRPVGTYSGMLSVKGSNASECVVPITVFVTNAAGEDIYPPAVAVSHLPAGNPSPSDSITITATADDTNRGNSTISECAMMEGNSGIWNAMGGSYGAVSVAATYSMGARQPGIHNITVRCTDSAGNSGYGLHDVNVTGAEFDTQGPVIVITAPSGDTIYPSPQWVNATATDSQSNIAGCRMNLSRSDGWSSGWLAMNATNGGYNALSEIVYFNNGSFLLPRLDTYTVNVSCNDTAGNRNHSTLTFTARYPYTGDILFLLKDDGTIPHWKAWVENNYASPNLTFMYSRELTAYIPYRTVIIADNLAKNNPLYNPAIENYLNNYKDTIPGNYVVLVGGGIGYSCYLSGIRNNGACNPGVDPDDSIRVIANNTPITSGFSTSSNTEIYGDHHNYLIHYLQNPNFPGLINLAKLNKPGHSDNQVVILNVSNVLTYGPELPDLFNSDGNKLGTRIIDYALNNSN